MSLVNEMLKDLEKRQAPSADNRLSGLTAVNEAEVETQRWHSAIWPALIVVLLAALFLLYRLLANDSTSSSSVESGQQSAEGSTTVVSPPLVKKLGPKLEQIEWLAEQQELSLSLEGVVGYELNGQDRDWVLDLKGMQPWLPSLPESLSPPIESLSFDTTAVSLRLHIKLSKALRPELAQSLLDSQQALLTLRFPAMEVQQQASSEPVVEQEAKKVVVPKPRPEKIQEQPPQPRDVAVENSVKTTRPPTAVQRRQLALVEAKRALEKGDDSLAEARLRALLDEQPEAEKAREMLCAMLLDRGRLAEASEQLEILGDSSLSRVSVAKLKARWLLASKQPEEALSLLDTHQPLLRAEPQFYELKAIAAQRSGNYSTSAQLYKALLNSDAARGDWWVGLAIAEELSANPRDAVEAYRQALTTPRLKPSLKQYANERLQALGYRS